MSKIVTAELLTDLNASLSIQLAGLVSDAVNAWIESATSRCWGETKETTELQNAAGVIWLDHMDVTEIEEIKVGYPNTDRTEVAFDQYSFSPLGRVILSYGRQTALPPDTLDYVQIKYSYGVPEADIPGDLRLAAIGIASGYAQYIINNGREVSRAQVGSYVVTYGSAAGDSGSGLRGGGSGTGSTTSRDWQVINAYAMRRV